MYSHDAHYRTRILLLQSRNRTDKHEFVGKPLLSISVLSTCICRTPETNRYDRPGSLVSDNWSTYSIRSMVWMTYNLGNKPRRRNKPRPES